MVIQNARQIWFHGFIFGLVEIIESVVITTFNIGALLLDLGTYDAAEVFIAKAIRLQSYLRGDGNGATGQWKKMIQVRRRNVYSNSHVY